MRCSVFVPLQITAGRIRFYNRGCELYKPRSARVMASFIVLVAVPLRGYPARTAAGYGTLQFARIIGRRIENNAL